MNEIKISGVLADWPKISEHRGGWKSCSATLSFDSKKFVVRIFATGDAGLQLNEFHKGDMLYIHGSLAMAPKGSLTIVVKEVSLIKMAVHHQEPRGVQELGLNKIDLEEYFLSKAD
jgi:lysyl-tRNA synthetase class II